MKRYASNGVAAFCNSFAIFLILLPVYIAFQKNTCHDYTKIYRRKGGQNSFF